MKLGGNIVHRHVDHLRPRTSKEEAEASLDNCLLPSDKDGKREEKETADDLSDGAQLEKRMTRFQVAMILVMR